MSQYFDTHAHLNTSAFEKDREVLIARFPQDQVDSVINVGYDLETTYKALSIFENHPNNYASAGLHPHEAKTLTPIMEKEFTKLAHHASIVAIGETGLDFYRNVSPKPAQYYSFEFHLELAKQANKPVIIHVRDAYDEVMDVLKTYRGSISGVIHTFGGDEKIAFQALDYGFYLSFSGVLTYKKSEALRALLIKLPVDQLLIETDCPYLSPQPFRGKRNQPAYIRYTAETMAQCLHLPSEKIAEFTGENARELFRIK